MYWRHFPPKKSVCILGVEQKFWLPNRIGNSFCKKAYFLVLLYVDKILCSRFEKLNTGNRFTGNSRLPKGREAFVALIKGVSSRAIAGKKETKKRGESTCWFSSLEKTTWPQLVKYLLSNGLFEVKATAYEFHGTFARVSQHKVETQITIL